MDTITARNFWTSLMHSHYCMYHVLERNKLGILLTRSSDCGCLVVALLLSSSSWTSVLASSSLLLLGNKMLHWNAWGENASRLWRQVTRNLGTHIYRMKREERAPSGPIWTVNSAPAMGLHLTDSCENLETYHFLKHY